MPDPAGSLSRTFSFGKKKGAWGLMPLQEGESQKNKSRARKEAVDGDGGSTRAVGLVLPPAALGLGLIWPGFLLRAAGDGEERTNLGVPCQSLSPHRTTGSRRSSGGWSALVGMGARPMFPGGRGHRGWFIALAGRAGCRGDEAGGLRTSSLLLVSSRRGYAVLVLSWLLVSGQR